MEWLKSVVDFFRSQVKRPNFSSFMLNAKTQLNPFYFQNNPDQPVRVEIINGTEYFCAKDVCHILEVGNTSQAISRLDQDDIILNDTIDKLGRTQKLSFVNEAGLYELIFASRKTEATEFKRWVCKKVLPDIRKNGKFDGQQLSQKEQALFLAKSLIQAEEENQRLQIENTQKQEVIQKQEEVIEQFIDAKEHKNYTQTADIIGMPQKKFLEYLRANGYVEKAGRRPTVKSKNLKIIETKWSDKGYERFLVTPKGIGYFKRKISLAK